MNDIKVVDNILKDFNEYRNTVKKFKYEDMQAQGKTYLDISLDADPKKLYEIIGFIMGFEPVDVINFTRLYRHRKEDNPTWIHTDASLAEYIAVFMIQPSRYIDNDALAFWKNRELDSIKYEIGSEATINNQTFDSDKWQMWEKVPFRANRLVIAPASYFHSKVNLKNTGQTTDDCRIVQVLFFNRGEKDVSMRLV